MRKGPLIFLIITLLVLAYLVRSVFTLLTLLFEDCSRDAIRLSEIPVPNSALIDARPQLVPKIIHQTYINDSIPVQWQAAQQSCLELHKDYEYKVSATAIRAHPCAGNMPGSTTGID